jgi:hypothetical protein
MTDVPNAKDDGVLRGQGRKDFDIHLPVRARGFKLQPVARPLLQQTDSIRPKVVLNPVQKFRQWCQGARGQDRGVGGRLSFDPGVADIDLGVRDPRNFPEECAFSRIAFKELKMMIERHDPLRRWRRPARETRRPIQYPARDHGFQARDQEAGRNRGNAESRAPEACPLATRFTLGCHFRSRPVVDLQAVRVFHVKHARRYAPWLRLRSR